MDREASFLGRRTCAALPSRDRWSRPTTHRFGATRLAPHPSPCHIPCHSRPTSTLTCVTLEPALGADGERPAGEAAYLPAASSASCSARPEDQHRRPGAADHRGPALPAEILQQLVRPGHGRTPVPLVQPVPGGFEKQCGLVGQGVHQQRRPGRVGRRIDVRHRRRQQSAGGRRFQRLRRHEHPARDLRPDRSASHGNSRAAVVREHESAEDRGCDVVGMTLDRTGVPQDPVAGPARSRPDRRPPAGRPRWRPRTSPVRARGAGCCERAAGARAFGHRGPRDRSGWPRAPDATRRAGIASAPSPVTSTA